MPDASRFHRRVAWLLAVPVGIVYVWFGALKLFGVSPADWLVEATLPYDAFAVPALGVFEVILGAAILVGRWPRITLALVAGHIVGTFLVFVTVPDTAFAEGSPARLTLVGEFVVKNIVILAAAAAATMLRVREAPRGHAPPESAARA